jgi:hypothetical protein
MTGRRNGVGSIEERRANMLRARQALVHSMTAEREADETVNRVHNVSVTNTPEIDSEAAARAIAAWKPGDDIQAPDSLAKASRDGLRRDAANALRLRANARAARVVLEDRVRAAEAECSEALTIEARPTYGDKARKIFDHVLAAGRLLNELQDIVLGIKREAGACGLPAAVPPELAAALELKPTCLIEITLREMRRLMPDADLPRVEEVVEFRPRREPARPKDSHFAPEVSLRGGDVLPVGVLESLPPRKSRASGTSLHTGDSDEFGD